ASGSSDRGYRTQVVAGDGSPVRTSSGLTLVPDAGLDGALRELDTLIVAGGRGSRAACEDESLVAFLRASAARARRTASVCTGAFPLAGAGPPPGRSRPSPQGAPEG